MRKYNANEILAMREKMQEMIEKKGELGLLLPFREILAMSEEEVTKNVDKVNELITKVPLISAEIMRTKYGFDLGLRNFDEKVEG